LTKEEEEEEVQRDSEIKEAFDNNIFLGCPIESRNKLRRSKLKIEALSKL